MRRTSSDTKPEGSPLALHEVADLTRHARCLLDQAAFLLDPEEVALRAIAMGTAIKDVEKRLLTAQQELMESQRRAVQALEIGIPRVPMIEKAIVSVGSIAEALELPEERALLASVRFNGLPEVVRQAFFILEATRELPSPHDLDPWLPELDGEHASLEPDTIQRWLLQGIKALLGTQEPSA